MKLLSLISLVCLLALRSIAQVNDPDTSTGNTIKQLYQLSLEELLLLKTSSASKFEETIKDIPHSVYVITKSDLEAYGYRTLAEALMHVPGFYMVDDHYNYKENFGIRGFYRDEWNHNVIFLVNGVRQRDGDSFNNSLSYINVPIQSIERIEIIKGASSVIYGTGAFMGVVNIITTSDKDDGGIYGSCGTQNTFNAGVNLNKHSDKMSITVNSGVGKTNGINQNYRDMGADTNLMSGKYMHEQFGYGSIVVKSGPFFSSLSFDKNRNTRPVASPPYISKVYEQKTDFMAFRSLIGINMNVSKWLEFNTSWQYQLNEEETFFDLFGLDNNLEWEKLTVQSDELDLNLKARYLDKMFSSLGFNLYSVTQDNNHIDVPLIGLSNWFSDVENPMNILGIYYRMGWEITSDLTLIAGVRFDKTNSYVEKRIVNTGNDIIDPQHIVTDSFRIEKYTYPDLGVHVLPEIALLYQPNNHNTFKFIYGTAINQPAPFNTKGASEGIKPEYIRNLEINHTSVFSSNLRLTNSLFYNHYYDLVTVEFYIRDSVVVQMPKNTGEISTLGFESILDYRPIHNLNISAALNYNHSTDLKHREVYPAFSPQLLAILNVSYRWQSFNFAITNQFTSATQPKYDYSLSDPANMNSAPIGRVGPEAPAYLNTGVNIRFMPERPGHIWINLRISNLFNQKMYYPVTDYNPWATKGTLGISRTMLLTLGYRM